MVTVADMPPQHAASALAKLVRWAIYSPAGPLVHIADVTGREEAVRTSALGHALAARAQCLDPGEAHAIAQGEPADTTHLVAHVMVELTQRTPLEAEPAIELASQIVRRLLDHYVITRRDTSCT